MAVINSWSLYRNNVNPRRSPCYCKNLKQNKMQGGRPLSSPEHVDPTHVPTKDKLLLCHLMWERIPLIIYQPKLTSHRCKHCPVPTSRLSTVENTFVDFCLNMYRNFLAFWPSMKSKYIGQIFCPYCACMEKKQNNCTRLSNAEKQRSPTPGP